MEKRCDCESVHCGHNAGACTFLPVAKIEVFGLRQKLCSSCLRTAQVFFGNIGDLKLIERVQ
jgi:hypothetical protein